jgi:hypothetical protein
LLLNEACFGTQLARRVTARAEFASNIGQLGDRNRHHRDKPADLVRLIDRRYAFSPPLDAFWDARRKNEKNGRQTHPKA